MPLRDDLLNPIPGENPSGANLRYAGVYDKIKEARRQDDDANQGEWQRERKLADYPQVIRLAGESLALKSKDLQLAAWLTEALLRSEGFAGLRGGLDLFKALIENFWDTLYPELEDGDTELRAAPIDWVGQRLEQAVKNVPLTRSGYDWFLYKQSRAVGYEADAAENSSKAEARETAIAEGKLTAEVFDDGFKATPKAFYVKAKEDVDGCLAAIETLNETCEPRFGNNAPGFGVLRSALEEVRQTINSLLQKKRELEPDEVTAAESNSDVAVVYSDDAAASADGALARPRKTISEEPVDRDDAALRIAAVAKYLRREDPYSPAAYLLLRGLRWGELRAAGASPELSVLTPPPTQIRQQLKQNAVDGNWQEVLETAETAMAMPCGRAWLDVQRYAVRASTEMGYEAIANAIRSELRGLLADIPGLPTWTLSDDTPTANPETQAWLRQIATPPDAASSAAESLLMDETPAPAEPGEVAPPDPNQLAMQAARNGDLQQAMEILSREIAHERSGRARFHRKVQLAQICMSTGNEAIAYPILEEMAAEIERLKLEEWETAEVVAHPLTLLFRCLNKLDGGEEEKRKLYARICRLDPMQALAVSK